MANLIEKNKRRNRVQFSVSRTLYQMYEVNQLRAKKNQVILDFSKDFDRWFTGQMEQVSKELQRLEEADAVEVSEVVESTDDNSASHSND